MVTRIAVNPMSITRHDGGPLRLTRPACSPSLNPKARSDRLNDKSSHFTGTAIMIWVKIGIEERPLDEADEQWIAKTINGLRKDQGDVCLQVRIEEPNLHVTLATPSCASAGGGGSRPPNDQERETFELWSKLHLNDVDFAPGNVIAFLKQLTH